MAPSIDDFHVVDYVVFALFLVVSLVIGLYHACRCFSGKGGQKTVNDFLLADRRLSTFPVAISMFVSLISGVLVLGHPAEVYTRGVQFLVRAFGHVMAGLLAGVLFVPLFFRLRLTSAFEYLEWRYNSKTVKLIGTVTNLFSTTFQMGIVLYAPAIALEAVCGLPLWISITSTALVAIIYTSLGGMKAVIWTDVFQAACMIAGMLAIIIQGVIKVGGFGNMWRISEEGGRTKFFDFDFDPTKRVTFWSAIFGGLFSSMAQFGIGQTSVQRYCALPHLRQAKAALFISCFLVFFIYVLATFVGLVIYAYYAGCDPLRMRYITSSNQVQALFGTAAIKEHFPVGYAVEHYTSYHHCTVMLVPYFIMEVLNYPGLPGAFLAVLFGGALSTMSSTLNSAAAVTWQDILRPFFKDRSDAVQTWITKLLVIIYGVLGVGLAFVTKFLGKHVVQIFVMVIGTFYGPTLGIFTLGAIFPFANAKGAIVGGTLSTLFSVWMLVGNFLFDPHQQPLPTSIEMCSNVTAAGDGSTNGSYIGQDWDLTTSFYDVTTATLPVETSSLTRFYGTSFLLYPIIGCFNTLIIGIIVSLITGGPDRPVDRQLLIPLFDVICPCLPVRWRRRLQCNFRHEEEEVLNGIVSSDKVKESNDYSIFRPNGKVSSVEEPANVQLMTVTKL